MYKYQLGQWNIDPTTCVIKNNDVNRTIEPKCMDLLMLLIKANGELVTREKIMKVIWEDRYVTEQVLNNQVALLRKHLNDGTKTSYIKTRPKKGYQLVTEAKRLNLNKDVAPAKAMSFNTVKDTSKLDSGHSKQLERASPTEEKPKTSSLISAKYKLITACITVLVITISAYIFVPTSNQKLTLAILPIDVLDTNEESRSFANGLVEEAIYQVSESSKLNVISRSSVFSIINNNLNAKEIASNLNADYIVEGSVRTENDIMRITTRLIDGKSGNLLWTRVFTANSGSVLLSQGEIAETLSAYIADSLQSSDTRLTLENGAIPREAYLHVLRGKKLNAQDTTEAYSLAIDEFLFATKVAPNYLEAHAGLALNYMRLGFKRALDWDEALRLAQESLQRALAIDPNHALSNATFGTYYQSVNNYEEAEKHYLKAIKNDPNIYVAVLNYANLLRKQGKYETALERYKQSLKLSPRSAPANWAIGSILVNLGRLDEALEHYKTCTKLLPNSTDCLTGLAYVQRLSNLNESANYTYEVLQEKTKPSDYWYKVVSAWHALWKNETTNAQQKYKDIFEQNSFAANGVTDASLVAWKQDDLVAWTEQLSTALESKRNIKTFAALAYSNYLQNDCTAAVENLEILLKHQPYYFDNYSVWLNALSYRAALAYCYKKLNRNEDFVLQLTALETSLSGLPENQAFAPGFELVKGHYHILNNEAELAKNIVNKMKQRNSTVAWMFEKDPIFASLSK